MTSLRVAMIAPPWLPIPPDGYGGLENVLAALVPELINLGVDIELFATGDSTMQTSKNHWLYESGQYAEIHRPQYDAMPISIAQILFALNTIRKDGGFDLIHDHNGFLGPLVFGYAEKGLPPVIHTLHGPPFSSPENVKLGAPDNLPMWRQFETASNLWIVPVSQTLADGAPVEIKSRLLPPVHNMIDVNQFPFVVDKDDYFITLARFHPEKGQHLAVKACMSLGYKLKMAGAVAGEGNAKKVISELADPMSPLHGIVDARYFKNSILPYLSRSIQHVGEVGGEQKMQFISRSKALLFPLQWDEPFGMVILEALACGTPVVAMRRGAMSEIITHGVNGFLADDLTDFKRYMKRVGDIDPQVCRDSVIRTFSAPVIAKKYLQRYRSVLNRVR